jgi:DNA-binding MarR family transcriptional regulator
MDQQIAVMRLEDEIKQTKGFKSEHHKATVNIMFTDGWIRDKFSCTLKPFDLTNQQYNVLRILRGSNPQPLSTSAIRDRMLDKMSDASRIVDRLFKKGLVSKETCGSDKRLVDVGITKEGLSVLEQIDGSVQFNNLLDAITEAEAAELNRILDKARG